MSKEEQRKHLIQTPSLSASIDSALQMQYFSVGDWPQKNWWEVFNEAKLSELIQEALDHNPSIQAAQSRIEFAKQEAIKSRASLFPWIFFDAKAEPQYLSKNGLYRALNPNLPLNGDLLDLSLNFEYEFDFWNKNRNLLQAALGTQQVLEAEQAQVSLMISTSIAQTYFGLKANLQRQNLYQRKWQINKEILTLQRLLQSNALLGSLPIYEMEQGVEVAAQDVYEITQSIENNYHQLNVLIGLGPDSEITLPSDGLMLPKVLAIPEGISMDLLARRPDLMASIWKAKSIAFEVGAAIADFYPNITLTGFAGFESFHFSDILSWSSKTAGLNPAIHLPIFTAGKIRANVRAKKASFDEAIYEYNNLLLTSAQEVADILSVISAIYEQQQAQAKIVKASQNQLFLTQIRMKHGLDNLLNTYYQELQLLDKQLQDIELKYEQFVASIKLIKSLGGGYTAESAVPIVSEGQIDE